MELILEGGGCCFEFPQNRFTFHCADYNRKFFSDFQARCYWNLYSYLFYFYSLIVRNALNRYGYFEHLWGRCYRLSTLSFHFLLRFFWELLPFEILMGFHYFFGSGQDSCQSFYCHQNPMNIHISFQFGFEDDF